MIMMMIMITYDDDDDHDVLMMMIMITYDVTASIKIDKIISTRDTFLVKVQNTNTTTSFRTSLQWLPLESNCLLCRLVVRSERWLRQSRILSLRRWLRDSLRRLRTTVQLFRIRLRASRPRRVPCTIRKTTVVARVATTSSRRRHWRRTVLVGAFDATKLSRRVLMQRSRLGPSRVFAKASAASRTRRLL